ncbi:MAG: Sua5/YciO/YrdC/YwlC family protein, partial [Candidatus Brocadiia bacterium]|nr:Sua5/YciO/YrdC/YwlC family protein [Candidatus Brocadiia bacterium]
MHTRLLDSCKAEDVRLAAGLLRGGQVVAFPTETVYGLGARADEEA